MNEMYSVVQVLARDQTYLLRDKYRQVSQRHCGTATAPSKTKIVAVYLLFTRHPPFLL